MAAEIKIVEEAKAQVGMNPKKFALWLFMVSVIMIFGALTSAYIVRQAEGNWLDFAMPTMFWVTSGLIVASSLTMQWSYIAFKKQDTDMSKGALMITAILGFGFLIGQWMGWKELVANGVYLVGRDSSGVSGSFIYVISGLHGLHVVSGVLVLLISLAQLFEMTLRLRLFKIIIFKIKFKKISSLEMCTTYWHFLGALWLYLFVFLLLNR
jgi:cytochrome c oxidase subunit III